MCQTYSLQRVLHHGSEVPVDQDSVRILKAKSLMTMEFRSRNKLCRWNLEELCTSVWWTILVSTEGLHRDYLVEDAYIQSQYMQFPSQESGLPEWSSFFQTPVLWHIRQICSLDVRHWEGVSWNCRSNYRSHEGRSSYGIICLCGVKRSEDPWCGTDQLDPWCGTDQEVKIPDVGLTN